MTRSASRRRTMRRLAAVGVAASGMLLAALVVRVGLDWSDAQPYAPWVETYYIVLAIAAVLLAAAGVGAGILLWLRARR